MYDWMWLIVGVLLGGALTALVFVLRRKSPDGDLAETKSRSAMLDEKLAERDEQIQSIMQNLNEVDQKREESFRLAAVLEEKLTARDQQFEAEKKLREEMEERFKDTFKAIGSDALATSNKQFLELAKQAFDGLLNKSKSEDEKTKQAIDVLLKPIRESLEKHNIAVGEIEKKREVAYKGLEEQIKMISESHEKLNTETHRLVTALRRPEQRGRWGEMQLRNVVELAGMNEHCDFDEQVSVWQGEDRQRPDMIARMPGGGVIVIDSKVALDAYLDAIQPDTDRDLLMKRHASQVENHFRSLAKKEYWNQFERTPKLVVMFMPLESALMAALEVKPDLHAEAMKNHVLIATPTLLVALLRAVAYGWQQEDVAENAREIANVGRDLYKRLAKFASHFTNVGKRLKSATEDYNASIGSLERNVLPGTRKLKELHATTDDDVDSPPTIDVEVRPLIADELRSLPADDS